MNIEHEAMDTLDQLRWLASNAYRLSFDANDHRLTGHTVEEEIQFNYEDDLEDEPEVRAECIRLDRLIVLQCYPNNSVGFYRAVHHDMDAAIHCIFYACVDEIQARLDGG